VVVDDNTQVRDLITIVLEQAGARVRACTNGAEALESLRVVGVPDVVVMDVNLSDMNGLSVMTTIRHLDDPAARAVPALALSGAIKQFGSELVLEAGFTECLNKPVSSMDLLVRTVRRLARRET
jgi:CheY-like chemotaxis protein